MPSEFPLPLLLALAFGLVIGGPIIAALRLLKARQVIHAVGPVWRGGDRGEPDLLAKCYRRSLGLAAQHELKSIAFPAISTGAYGYPLEDATQIAIREAREFEKKHPAMRIVFCCFSTSDAEVYRRYLAS